MKLETSNEETIGVVPIISLIASLISLLAGISLLERDLSKRFAADGNKSWYHFHKRPFNIVLGGWRDHRVTTSLASP